MEESLKNDPNKFWSFIHQKNKTTVMPGVMKFGDLTLSSQQDIVNAFPHHFSSVYLLNCDVPAIVIIAVILIVPVIYYQMLTSRPAVITVIRCVARRYQSRLIVVVRGKRQIFSA